MHTRQWAGEMRAITGGHLATFVFGLLLGITAAVGDDTSPDPWRTEWPRTDFGRHDAPFAQIRSGGPSKDGIPAIDAPRYDRLVDGKASGWAANIRDIEPVISLVLHGDARTYPLRILIWHEIVNDVVGGTPALITYCPLCNASLVFDRTVSGRVLDFGTTGKLRNSDLVMYDRQTESWWQQFTGEAIVGTMTGQQLHPIPSRLESFGLFRQRFPEGLVLVPNDPGARRYGENPYVDYDAPGRKPFLYDGSLPEGIEPMERVVAVEIAPGHFEAWPLSLLRQRGLIASGDVVLSWLVGQTSAVDRRRIQDGREVGNITVQRQRGGTSVDIPYDVPFAFAFHAFRPSAPIHKEASDPHAK